VTTGSDDGWQRLGDGTGPPNPTAGMPDPRVNEGGVDHQRRRGVYNQSRHR
jgi:hypothetical protein